MIATSAGTEGNGVVMSFLSNTELKWERKLRFINFVFKFTLQITKNDLPSRVVERKGKGGVGGRTRKQQRYQIFPYPTLLFLKETVLAASEVKEGNLNIS